MSDGICALAHSRAVSSVSPGSAASRVVEDQHEPAAAAGQEEGGLAAAGAGQAPERAQVVTDILTFASNKGMSDYFAGIFRGVPSHDWSGLLAILQESNQEEANQEEANIVSLSAGFLAYMHTGDFPGIRGDADKETVRQKYFARLCGYNYYSQIPDGKNGVVVPYNVRSDLESGLAVREGDNASRAQFYERIIKDLRVRRLAEDQQGPAAAAGQEEGGLAAAGASQAEGLPAGAGQEGVLEAAGAGQAEGLPAGAGNALRRNRAGGEPAKDPHTTPPRHVTETGNGRCIEMSPVK